MRTEENPQVTPAQESLHQTLLSLGRQWFGSSAKRSASAPIQLFPEAADHALAHRVQQLTIQQLCTALRMQGVDSEDETMLHTLEGLVLAGEIPFTDFVGRLQNLFPHGLENLDVSLRMKVAALLIEAH